MPRDALQSMGGENVAFVRKRGRFERRDVKTGKSDDGRSRSSRPGAGEEIAVKNTFLLKAELGKGESRAPTTETGRSP